MQDRNLSDRLHDALSVEATGTQAATAKESQSAPKIGKRIPDGTIQKSKRRHAPKVRTGCLTCKKRRVKCDEAKPHCRRCLTSRTTCDGYAKPVPVRAPRLLVQRELSSASSLASSSNPKVSCRNDNEAKYLHLYKTDIASFIGGSFPSKVWEVILPQAAQEDHFVLSMILAISAGICSRRASKEGDPLLSNEHNAFSLKQYQRALQELANSTYTQDEHPRRALISHLLISCFEALSGNVLSCLVQAQAGHDLLQNWIAATPYPNQSRVGISSPAPHIIEHELIQAVYLFDLQLLQHFDSRAVAVHRELKYEGEDTIKRMPHNFTDVDEARAYWMLVQRRAAHFVWEASATTSFNDENSYAESSSTVGGADSPFGGDLERQRSVSVSTSFVASHTDYISSHYSSRTNSTASNFGNQEASLQVLEHSTLVSPQSVEYIPGTTAMPADSMLFDPMFDFLSPPPPMPFQISMSDSSHEIASSTTTTPGVTQISHFSPTPILSTVSATQPLDIFAMHHKYSKENLRWRLSFSHLYSRLKKSANPSLISAANILFIQSIASEIQLSTILSLVQQPSDNQTASFSSRNQSLSSSSIQSTSPPPPVATSPLNDYREVVSTSRAVVESKKLQNGKGNSSIDFVFEVGITQALYTVIQNCPDVGIRQDALEVLRWYGCREGAWDCLGLVDGAELHEK